MHVKYTVLIHCLDLSRYDRVLYIAETAEKPSCIPGSIILIRGAIAVGLSPDDHANLAVGSGSVAEQQQAQGSNGDAAVVGAAGAAAFLWVYS